MPSPNEQGSITTFRNVLGDYDAGYAVRWKVSLPRSLLQPLKVKNRRIGMRRDKFDKERYRGWEFAEQSVIDYLGLVSCAGKNAHADGFEVLDPDKKKKRVTVRFVDVKTTVLGTKPYFELWSSSTQISRLLKKRPGDKFDVAEGYYLIVDLTENPPNKPKIKQYPVYRLKASDVYDAFMDK